MLGFVYARKHARRDFAPFGFTCDAIEAICATDRSSRARRRRATRRRRRAS